MLHTGQGEVALAMPGVAMISPRSPEARSPLREKDFIFPQSFWVGCGVRRSMEGLWEEGPGIILKRESWRKNM